jgi:hypothetical protein
MFGSAKKCSRLLDVVSLPPQRHNPYQTPVRFWECGRIRSLIGQRKWPRAELQVTAPHSRYHQGSLIIDIVVIRTTSLLPSIVVASHFFFFSPFVPSLEKIWYITCFQLHFTSLWKPSHLVNTQPHASRVIPPLAFQPQAATKTKNSRKNKSEKLQILTVEIKVQHNDPPNGRRIQQTIPTTPSIPTSELRGLSSKFSTAILQPAV